VEVPVNWYSITGMIGSNITLTGSGIIPDPTPDPTPDPETSVALADFAYVQALYNTLRTKYPVGTSQNLLLEAIATDNNKAARKAYQYYNALLAEGKTKTQALSTLSRDFNLDLTK
jgi:hypothetical protein